MFLRNVKLAQTTNYVILTNRHLSDTMQAVREETTANPVNASSGASPSYETIDTIA